jgi:hypothetical protein
MLQAWTSVALAAAALIVVAAAALRIDGVARVFLLAQAAYWSLSYVARPAVLLWVRPAPEFADNVADPRLAAIGYDHAIIEVLRPVVFGLWVYAVLVVGYALWRRGRRAPGPTARDPDLPAALLATYLLGLVGRAAAVATGSAGSAGEVQSANAVLSLAADLGSFGAVGLLVFYRPLQRRTAVLAIGALLVGELLWTVAIESKTPIMGAALAVAVRFAHDGWTRRRVTAIVGTAVAGIGAFGWLQSLKLSASAASAAELTDARYPTAVQPFLSLLRRFDLLEAATDAYYLGGREWLSGGDVVGYALQSLVPAQLLGDEKFHSGTAWASQVRGASVDMFGVSVSLADGSINEGYVLGGYPGVVAGALFTFGLLLGAVAALRARHIALIVVGLALTESPVLFERGFLGSMEVVGKSLQIALLAWIVDLTVREIRRRVPGRRDVATATSGPSAPTPTHQAPSRARELSTWH